jgi:hypothetical protein
MFNKSACLIENKNFSFTCVDSETPIFTVCVIFFPLNVGVKQGDNLRTNLFKIFVNDLPSYLSNTSDPVNVNGKDIWIE